MSVHSYLRALPKAELHLHLEGAIPAAALLELAQAKNVKLPGETIDELNVWFKFRDFDHFLEMFTHIYKCVIDAKDFELITVALAKDLASQNVRYAEISFSPSAHKSRGIPEQVFLEGLKQGRARAEAEFGVLINWIFDISRHRDLSYADYTTELAINCQNEGVLALGLAGQEVGYPAETFAEFFARARKAGLKCAPHAGELVGPESVWDALNSLRADRIAHGVRANEDLALIKHLSEQEIALSICPTSNICLGVFADIKAHPLPALYAEEVQFTINTDDPTLFNTTLNQEFELLYNEMGFDLSSIDEIILNGVKQSFLSGDKKKELLSSFKLQMSDLRHVHLMN
jgi:adenosine deaminase